MTVIGASAEKYVVLPALATLLMDVLVQNDVRSGIFNFRDPNYSSENGGYHPVEIMVLNGRISYVTDFSYVGTGYCRELAKEIDWDFGEGSFEHFGRMFEIDDAGIELWEIWQRNFVEYFNWGVYQVSFEEL